MGVRQFSKIVSALGTTQSAATVYAVTLPPPAVLAELIASLESVRTDYLYHRFSLLDSQIQQLEQRLESALNNQRDLNLGKEIVLIRASLLVLKGRVLARRKLPAASGAFRDAIELFRSNPLPNQAQIIITRLRTDFAIALYRLNFHDEAIEILEGLCQESKAHSDAYAYLGYAKMQAHDWLGAGDLLRKALETCPAQPTVLYWLGRSLLKRGQRTEAEECLCRGGTYALTVQDYPTAAKCGGRALLSNPFSVDALRLTVEAYRPQKRIKRAFRLVEVFLKQQPGSTQALVLRAILLRDSQRIEESLGILRSLPAGGPDREWISQELLNSLYEGRAAVPRGELLAAADDVLTNSPEHVVALCAKGEVCLARQQYTEALRLFESAIRVSAKNAAALVGAGASSEGLGDRIEAFAYYRRAARQGQGDPQLFVQAIDAMRRVGEPQEVLDELETLSSGPLAHFALWCRGNLLNEMGDQDGGLANLEAAASLSAQRGEEQLSPGLLIDYGHALRHANRYADADRVFTRALEIQKLDPDTLGSWAHLLSDIGEFKRALAYVQTALEIAPDRANLLDQSGWCMQHMSDLDGAWKAYAMAYELDGNPWYRKGLANVLMNYPDQRETARRHFRGVLEDLRYSSELAPSQERPAGNTTLGLLGWCNYRLGHYAEAIRLFQVALEASPDMHPLWFDLALAFLASGRGLLAKQAYDAGCVSTEKVEVPRRRGVYYIAVFDLAELARGFSYPLPPEAAEIYAGLRVRLGASGQDLRELVSLPEALTLSPPPEREAAMQVISEAALSASEDRRVFLHEFLRAAAVQFRDDNWHCDLLLRAHADDWPEWAVQCLRYPEKIWSSYVLWRLPGDMLVHAGIRPWKTICRGEIYLFDEMPTPVREPMAKLRARLDDARISFPYSGDRACRVAALEMIGEIGQEVFAALMPNPAAELVEFRNRQLLLHGLSSAGIVKD